MRTETLSEQLYFTTVRITTEYADGRQMSGTGFVYQVSTAPDRGATFFVTNKHVIQGATQAAIHLLGSIDAAMTAPKLGEFHELVVQDPETHFVGHPDPAVDITVLAASPILNAFSGDGDHIFFRSISSEIALNPRIEDTLDALEEVAFVGYPAGIFDATNGLPIVRRGVTATPLQVDYQGTPTFLVDAAVFPGSSGSPVFIANTGGYSGRGGGFVVGNRLILLGVIASVYQNQLPVQTAGGPHVMDPIGLGIVYKASTVDEVVDVILTSVGLTRHASPEDGAIQVSDPAVDALRDEAMPGETPRG